MFTALEEFHFKYYFVLMSFSSLPVNNSKSKAVPSAFCSPSTFSSAVPRVQEEQLPRNEKENERKIAAEPLITKPIKRPGTVFLCQFLNAIDFYFKKEFT